ncbi:hypothetical protein [Thalassomonas actiniarum]|uniref:Flavodoxin-like fold domain-containing protein n=1 Tax=Thalassomonas actiniarum TaxID=485447 RepID=A0AAF0C4P7_9GAMM|nr:hypothetical protein [Thalassomonas actiniarum]WDE02517.1 hypothetical protein SG35_029360 [Thalassomonas actiniarum]
MKKLLVISGHPKLEVSLANKTILNLIEEKTDNLKVRRLDSLYPGYQIDVEAE